MTWAISPALRLLFTWTASLLLTTPAAADPFLQGLSIEWKDFAPYKEPSKRFLDKNPYKTVESKLRQQGFSIKQKNFYDTVMEQEERGYIGYSASSYAFRVFQDIVKMTLEEVLQLEFKKDFHFFRIPGDPELEDFMSAGEFLSRFPNVNDNLPEQRDQLVSTNFTLYNNYDQMYECSIYYFETAYSYKPPNFEKKIEYLFKQLGMERYAKVKNKQVDRIAALFEIGMEIEKKGGGTLFQFFDLSHQVPVTHNAYELIDRLTYPAMKKGEPVPYKGILSDLYQGTKGSNFLNQYRIVVNHFDMLNPYGPFYIRRYDLNDPKVVRQYEQKLRSAIRKIVYDKQKAAVYREKLRSYWNFQGFN